MKIETKFDIDKQVFVCRDGEIICTQIVGIEVSNCHCRNPENGLSVLYETVAGNCFDHTKFFSSLEEAEKN